MPTVALLTEAFVTLAELAARGLGLPTTPVFAFPHPLNPRPADEVERLGLDSLDDVVARLIGAPGVSGPA